ncbi:MAG: hypothetical protein HY764_01810 [Candidatus Portnoybacteria bacterium]|nr:hypothetical protein [Candidatus Portnoybacteria bacterium]
MDKCEEGYGKQCFACKSERREFNIVSTGAGMDIEMLHDFGERQIAINCFLQKGFLVLQLTKDAIREISKEQVENLNKVDVAEIPKLIERKDVQEYLDNHGEEVSIKVYNPCTISPPFP